MYKVPHLDNKKIQWIEFLTFLSLLMLPIILIFYINIVTGVRYSKVDNDHLQIANQVEIHYWKTQGWIFVSTIFLLWNCVFIALKHKWNKVILVCFLIGYWVVSIMMIYTY